MSPDQNSPFQTETSLSAERKSNNLLFGVNLILLAFCIFCEVYMVSGWLNTTSGLWRDRNHLILISVTGIGILSTLGGVIFSRTSKWKIANGLFFITIWLMTLSVPVLFTGMRLVLPLLTMIIVSVVANQAQEGPIFVYTMIASILVVAISYLIDWYGPATRLNLYPHALSVNRIATSFLIAGNVVFLLIRFNRYPLRTKLILAFMAISMLSFVAGAYITIRVQMQQSFLQSIQAQIRNIEFFSLVSLSIAGTLGVFLSQVFVAPIVRLIGVARRAVSGDRGSLANVEANDEIGTLASIFNQMTDELQKTVAGLEKGFDERTEDLEQRSRKLQSAVQIGREAVMIRSMADLLPELTRRISEEFNLYHVSIYILDETGNYAVLRAANSEGGQRMLARGYRILISQPGMVGYVMSTREPRIALDSGDDAQFLNNPDLPMTRSEMALPLILGNRILGILDVQSTITSAFNREDIAVMQVLADLIASAIENARLFAESREALDTMRRAYGDQSRKGWAELFNEIARRGGSLGYRGLEHGTVPLMREEIPTGNQTATEGPTLSIPIKVRDRVIGYIDTVRPVDRGDWSPEELDMVKLLADQLSVALESARLYEATISRADRDRLLGELTGRLRESLDIDTVLRTAVQEMRRVLNIDEVEVRIDDHVSAP